MRLVSEVCVSHTQGTRVTELVCMSLWVRLKVAVSVRVRLVSEVCVSHSGCESWRLCHYAGDSRILDPHVSSAAMYVNWPKSFFK